METKNLAVKVSMDLWRAITIVATNGNKTLAEVVVPVLEKAFGGLMAPKVKAEVKVAPAPVSTPAKPSPLDKQTEGYVEVITPMAKCRKCGEPFPVADMVTEPKTGRLFCPDCVENMRNNQ